MSAARKPAPSSVVAYSVKDAAAAVGVSLSLLERAIKRGDVTVRWLDGKRVVLATELTEYAESLPLDKPQ